MEGVPNDPVSTVQGLPLSHFFHVMDRTMGPLSSVALLGVGECRSCLLTRAHPDSFHHHVSTHWPFRFINKRVLYACVNKDFGQGVQDCFSI